MPRPVFFEIPAEKPERAMAFYQSAFGWKFEKFHGSPFPYWLVSTGEGPGIDGGLMERRDPRQPFANTLDVPDLDAALAAVTASGGVCVMPRMAIRGTGWLAYCNDTEGVMFGLMQMDRGAA